MIRLMKKMRFRARKIFISAKWAVASMTKNISKKEVSILDDDGDEPADLRK